MRTATFNPDAYRVTDLKQAKHITVGDVGNTDGETHAKSEQRWIEETEYTLEFIEGRFPKLSCMSDVVDYGCGTGRISKGLIERTGCSVAGVDASPSMRLVASRYVQRREFRTCEPKMLMELQGQFNFAICLWVLQHSGMPVDDAYLLHTALRQGGRLLIMNETQRFVPTMEMGFVHDGFDIRGPLNRYFGAPVAEGKLDPERVHPKFSERTFWAEYVKQ